MRRKCTSSRSHAAYLHVDARLEIVSLHRLQISYERQRSSPIGGFRAYLPQPLTMLLVQAGRLGARPLIRYMLSWDRQMLISIGFGSHWIQVPRHHCMDHCLAAPLFSSDNSARKTGRLPQGDRRRVIKWLSPSRSCQKLKLVLGLAMISLRRWHG